MKKYILIVLAIALLLTTIRCGYMERERDVSGESVNGEQELPDSVADNSDEDGDGQGSDFDNPVVVSTPTPTPGYDEYTGFRDITAAELVADIRVGWSLGNTLDAHNGPGGFANLGGGVYANTTVTELETGWGRPVTLPAHFAVLKDAGFNAIRIPVTWFKVIDEEHNIREDWMARVKEVVDYAVELDMYVVVNTHHDDILFQLVDDEIENSKIAHARIWEQIAEAFKDYNEKLLFEGLNEPRTIGSPDEWRGGTPEEHRNLNTLNQVFVDTVRSTGGNNAKRILLVPTYAASANETAQRAFALPEDSAIDKLIVSLHYYEPWNFALRTGAGSVSEWSADNLDDTAPIMRAFDLAHELFVSRGIPVIMGEMGAINRDNLEARVAWAEFYTAYATSKGIPCFWWDNGSYWVLRRRDWGWEQTFGLLDRVNIEIAHPEIVEALMRGTS
ncbi:MAG: glycoside hydrolase family 5 protein [Oscillospiraceae bacterium]|nr:glycoside hydrolase family 5 protein [Oscillospiraceae bacterium]